MNGVNYYAQGMLFTGLYSQCGNFRIFLSLRFYKVLQRWFHVLILVFLHCVFLTFVNGSLLQKCNFLVFIFATPLELNSNKFCDERNDQALDNFTSIFPTLTSEVRIQLIFITCPIMITYLYFSRTYGFVNKMTNLTTLKACFGLVTLLDFYFGDTPMTGRWFFKITLV